MKLFSWFRRKKKKKEKEEELTIFGEPIKKETEKSSRSFRKDLKQVLSGFKPKRKIRFKHLLKLKRILAGCLFLMYSIISVMVIPEPFALLFFATSFILLDYLWKTRNIQWFKEEDEK